jgi:hypothetical protein
MAKPSSLSIRKLRPLKPDNSNPQAANPTRSIWAGLLVAQAVATLQVRQSNLALHAKMEAVRQAGFLSVPNQFVLPSLKALTAAFWGGLFFTLSLGAGLTLGTMAAAWLLPCAGPRSRLQRYLPIFLWALLLIWINLSGFDLYVNLYFVLIPPVVFLLNRRRIETDRQWRNMVVHVLPVIFLALMWFTQFDRHLFVDIRDRLLLSNPIGQRVNHFYYHYTLYAAEVFKSPSQKLIKTSFIDISPKSSQHQLLEHILSRFDWLPVKSGVPVDLIVRQNQQRLELTDAGRVVSTTTIGEMRRKPEIILQQFAQKTDRYDRFRRMTFYGLLYGFPILLYIGAHVVFRRLWDLLPNVHRSVGLASASCLLLGVVIWAFFQHGRVDIAGSENIAEALSSGRWQVQVAALRRCREEGIDVRRMVVYPTLKKSRHIPVRYWLVDALAVSRYPQVDDELTDFLDDPSLNVCCQACAVLGQRGDPKVIEKLLHLVNQSKEWYLQLYSYNALKALGWNQIVSE